MAAWRSLLGSVSQARERGAAPRRQSPAAERLWGRQRNRAAAVAQPASPGAADAAAVLVVAVVAVVAAAEMVPRT